MVNRQRWLVRSVMAVLAGLAGSAPGCGIGSSGWRGAERYQDLLAGPGSSQPTACSYGRLRERSGTRRWPWSTSILTSSRRIAYPERSALSRRWVRRCSSRGRLTRSALQDRFEATLQTIRRAAVIHVEPAPTGGFLVKVEVYKFLEDMAKPDRQPAGRAVFNNDFPVNRTREVIGPVPAPLGWILRGRDADLEQAILAGVRDALFL